MARCNIQKFSAADIQAALIKKALVLVRQHLLEFDTAQNKYINYVDASALLKNATFAGDVVTKFNETSVNEYFKEKLKLIYSGFSGQEEALLLVHTIVDELLKTTSVKIDSKSAGTLPYTLTSIAQTNNLLLAEDFDLSIQEQFEQLIFDTILEEGKNSTLAIEAATVDLSNIPVGVVSKTRYDSLRDLVNYRDFNAESTAAAKSRLDDYITRVGRYDVIDGENYYYLELQHKDSHILYKVAPTADGYEVSYNQNGKQVQQMTVAQFVDMFVQPVDKYTLKVQYSFPESKEAEYYENEDAEYKDAIEDLAKERTVIYTNYLPKEYWDVPNTMSTLLDRLKTIKANEGDAGVLNFLTANYYVVNGYLSGNSKTTETNVEGVSIDVRVEDVIETLTNSIGTIYFGSRKDAYLRKRLTLLKTEGNIITYSLGDTVKRKFGANSKVYDVNEVLASIDGVVIGNLGFRTKADYDNFVSNIEGRSTANFIIKQPVHLSTKKKGRHIFSTEGKRYEEYEQGKTDDAPQQVSAFEYSQMLRRQGFNVSELYVDVDDDGVFTNGVVMMYSYDRPGIDNDLLGDSPAVKVEGWRGRRKMADANRVAMVYGKRKSKVMKFGDYTDLVVPLTAVRGENKFVQHQLFNFAQSKYMHFNTAETLKAVVRQKLNIPADADVVEFIKGNPEALLTALRAESQDANGATNWANNTPTLYYMLHVLFNPEALYHEDYLNKQGDTLVPKSPAQYIIAMQGIIRKKFAKIDKAFKFTGKGKLESNYNSALSTANAESYHKETLKNRVNTKYNRESTKYSGLHYLLNYQVNGKPYVYEEPTELYLKYLTYSFLDYQSKTPSDKLNISEDIAAELYGYYGTVAANSEYQLLNKKRRMIKSLLPDRYKNQYTPKVINESKVLQEAKEIAKMTELTSYLVLGQLSGGMFQNVLLNYYKEIANNGEAKTIWNANQTIGQGISINFAVDRRTRTTPIGIAFDSKIDKLAALESTTKGNRNNDFLVFDSMPMFPHIVFDHNEGTEAVSATQAEPVPQAESVVRVISGDNFVIEGESEENVIFDFVPGTVSLDRFDAETESAKKFVKDRFLTEEFSTVIDAALEAANPDGVIMGYVGEISNGLMHLREVNGKVSTLSMLEETHHKFLMYYLPKSEADAILNEWATRRDKLPGNLGEKAKNFEDGVEGIAKFWREYWNSESFDKPWLRWVYGVLDNLPSLKKYFEMLREMILKATGKYDMLTVYHQRLSSGYYRNMPLSSSATKANILYDLESQFENLDELLLGIAYSTDKSEKELKEEAYSVLFTAAAIVQREMLSYEFNTLKSIFMPGMNSTRFSEYYLKRKLENIAKKVHLPTKTITYDEVIVDDKPTTVKNVRDKSILTLADELNIIFNAKNIYKVGHFFIYDIDNKGQQQIYVTNPATSKFNEIGTTFNFERLGISITNADSLTTGRELIELIKTELNSGTVLADYAEVEFKGTLFTPNGLTESGTIVKALQEPELFFAATMADVDYENVNLENFEVEDSLELEDAQEIAGVNFSDQKELMNIFNSMSQEIKRYLYGIRTSGGTSTVNPGRVDKLLRTSFEMLIDNDTNIDITALNHNELRKAVFTLLQARFAEHGKAETEQAVYDNMFSTDYSILTTTIGDKVVEALGAQISLFTAAYDTDIPAQFNNTVYLIATDNYPSHGNFIEAIGEWTPQLLEIIDRVKVMSYDNFLKSNEYQELLKYYSDYSKKSADMYINIIKQFLSNAPAAYLDQKITFNGSSAVIKASEKDRIQNELNKGVVSKFFENTGDGYSLTDYGREFNTEEDRSGQLLTSQDAVKFESGKASLEIRSSDLVLIVGSQISTITAWINKLDEKNPAFSVDFLISQLSALGLDITTDAEILRRYLSTTSTNKGKGIDSDTSTSFERRKSALETILTARLLIEAQRQSEDGELSSSTVIGKFALNKNKGEAANLDNVFRLMNAETVIHKEDSRKFKSNVYFPAREFKFLKSLANYIGTELQGSRNPGFMQRGSLRSFNQFATSTSKILDYFLNLEGKFAKLAQESSAVLDFVARTKFKYIYTPYYKNLFVDYKTETDEGVKLFLGLKAKVRRIVTIQDFENVVTGGFKKFVNYTNADKLLTLLNAWNTTIDTLVTGYLQILEVQSDRNKALSMPVEKIQSGKYEEHFNNIYMARFSYAYNIFNEILAEAANLGLVDAAALIPDSLSNDVLRSKIVATISVVNNLLQNKALKAKLTGQKHYVGVTEVVDGIEVNKSAINPALEQALNESYDLFRVHKLFESYIFASHIGQTLKSGEKTEKAIVKLLVGEDGDESNIVKLKDINRNVLFALETQYKEALESKDATKATEFIQAIYTLNLDGTFNESYSKEEWKSIIPDVVTNISYNFNINGFYISQLVDGDIWKFKGITMTALVIDAAKRANTNMTPITVFALRSKEEFVKKYKNIFNIIKIKDTVYGLTSSGQTVVQYTKTDLIPNASALKEKVDYVEYSNTSKVKEAEVAAEGFVEDIDIVVVGSEKLVLDPTNEYLKDTIFLDEDGKPVLTSKEDGYSDEGLFIDKFTKSPVEPIKAWDGVVWQLNIFTRLAKNSMGANNIFPFNKLVLNDNSHETALGTALKGLEVEMTQEWLANGHETIRNYHQAALTAGVLNTVSYDLQYDSDARIISYKANGEVNPVSITDSNIDRHNQSVLKSLKHIETNSLGVSLVDVRNTTLYDIYVENGAWHRVEKTSGAALKVSEDANDAVFKAYIAARANNSFIQMPPLLIASSDTMKKLSEHTQPTIKKGGSFSVIDKLKAFNLGYILPIYKKLKANTTVVIGSQLTYLAGLGSIANSNLAKDYHMLLGDLIAGNRNNVIDSIKEFESKVDREATLSKRSKASAAFVLNKLRVAYINDGDFGLKNQLAQDAENFSHSMLFADFVAKTPSLFRKGFNLRGFGAKVAQLPATFTRVIEEMADGPLKTGLDSGVATVRRALRYAHIKGGRIVPTEAIAPNFYASEYELSTHTLRQLFTFNGINWEAPDYNSLVDSTNPLTTLVNGAPVTNQVSRLEFLTSFIEEQTAISYASLFGINDNPFILGLLKNTMPISIKKVEALLNNPKFQDIVVQPSEFAKLGRGIEVAKAISLKEALEVLKEENKLNQLVNFTSTNPNIAAVQLALLPKIKAEQVTRMHNLNKSLYGLVTRIPTTGKNSSTIYRTVAFQYDMGNAIILPSEFMIPSGSDYDGDTLQMWTFGNSDKFSDANTALEVLFEIYTNPDNISETHATLNMDYVQNYPAKSKFNMPYTISNWLKSLEAAQVGKGSTAINAIMGKAQAYAAIAASHIKQIDISKITATEYPEFTKLKKMLNKQLELPDFSSLKDKNNNWDFGRRLGTVVSNRLGFYTNAGVSITNWLETLINAAVDNTKYFKLGDLNIDKVNSDIIAGLTLMGFPKEMQVEMMQVPGVMKLLDDARSVDNIIESRSSSQQLRKLIGGGISVEQFIKEYNELSFVSEEFKKIISYNEQAINVLRASQALYTSAAYRQLDYDIQYLQKQGINVNNAAELVEYTNNVPAEGLVGKLSKAKLQEITNKYYAKELSLKAKLETAMAKLTAIHDTLEDKASVLEPNQVSAKIDEDTYKALVENFQMSIAELSTPPTEADLEAVVKRRKELFNDPNMVAQLLKQGAEYGDDYNKIVSVLKVTYDIKGKLADQESRLKAIKDGFSSGQGTGKKTPTIEEIALFMLELEADVERELATLPKDKVIDRKQAEYELTLAIATTKDLVKAQMKDSAIMPPIMVFLANPHMKEFLRNYIEYQDLKETHLIFNPLFSSIRTFMMKDLRATKLVHDYNINKTYRVFYQWINGMFLATQAPSTVIGPEVAIHDLATNEGRVSFMKSLPKELKELAAATTVKYDNKNKVVEKNGVQVRVPKYTFLSRLTYSDSITFPFAETLTSPEDQAAYRDEFKQLPDDVQRKLFLYLLVNTGFNLDYARNSFARFLTTDVQADYIKFTSKKNKELQDYTQGIRKEVPTLFSNTKINDFINNYHIVLSSIIAQPKTDYIDQDAKGRLDETIEVTSKKATPYNFTITSEQIEQIAGINKEIYEVDKGLSEIRSQIKEFRALLKVSKTEQEGDAIRKQLDELKLERTKQEKIRRAKTQETKSLYNSAAKITGELPSKFILWDKVNTNQDGVPTDYFIYNLKGNAADGYEYVQQPKEFHQLPVNPFGIIGKEAKDKRQLDLYVDAFSQYMIEDRRRPKSKVKASKLATIEDNKLSISEDLLKTKLSGNSILLKYIAGDNITDYTMLFKNVSPNANMNMTNKQFIDSLIGIDKYITTAYSDLRRKNIGLTDEVFNLLPEAKQKEVNEALKKLTCE